MGDSLWWGGSTLPLSLPPPRGLNQDKGGMAQDGGVSPGLPLPVTGHPGPWATRLVGWAGGEGAVLDTSLLTGPSANPVGAESTPGFLEGREGLFAR